jgi:hypothetical protein
MKMTNKMMKVNVLSSSCNAKSHMSSKRGCKIVMLEIKGVKRNEM